MSYLETDTQPQTSTSSEANHEMKSDGDWFRQTAYGRLILLSDVSFRGGGQSQVGVVCEARDTQDDASIHISLQAQLLPIGDAASIPRQFGLSAKKFEVNKMRFADDATALLMRKSIQSIESQGERSRPAEILESVISFTSEQHNIIDDWSLEMKDLMSKWFINTSTQGLGADNPDRIAKTLLVLPRFLECTYKNGYKVYMQQGLSVQWEETVMRGLQSSVWVLPSSPSLRHTNEEVQEATQAGTQLQQRFYVRMISHFETSQSNTDLHLVLSLFATKRQQRSQFSLYDLTLAQNTEFVEAIQPVLRECEENGDWHLQWKDHGTKIDTRVMIPWGMWIPLDQD